MPASKGSPTFAARLTVGRAARWAVVLCAGLAAVVSLRDLCNAKLRVTPVQDIFGTATDATGAARLRDEKGVAGNENLPLGLMHKPNAVFTTAPQKLGYVFDKELDDGNQNHTLQPAFAERIERLRQMNTNVLFVYEDLVPVDPRRLQTLYDILSPDWNVQTVIAYRSFHETLVSVFNQMEKTKIKGRWPTQVETTAIAPFEIDTVDACNDDKIAMAVAKMFSEFASKRKHPDKVLSDLYEPFFGPMTIMRPLAATTPVPCDPLLDELLCRITRSMPHLCRACHDGEFSANVFTNPSLSLNYDRLAVAAYKRGWIKPTMTRLQAYEQIAQFQKNEGLSQHDFPLICMSQEKLNRLESTSLAMEEDLFDKAADAVAFHSGFVDMNRTYCSIDTNRTLDDPSWRNFFLSNMTV